MELSYEVMAIQTHPSRLAEGIRELRRLDGPKLGIGVRMTPVARQLGIPVMVPDEYVGSAGRAVRHRSSRNGVMRTVVETAMVRRLPAKQATLVAAAPLQVEDLVAAYLLNVRAQASLVGSDPRIESALPVEMQVRLRQLRDMVRVGGPPLVIPSDGNGLPIRQWHPLEVLYFLCNGGRELPVHYLGIIDEYVRTGSFSGWQEVHMPSNLRLV